MLNVVKILLLAMLVGFSVTTLANLGTTVYMHRALAHKALTLHPIASFCARLTVWLSTGIRPRQWVAVHRKHHAFTDQEGDPHSPVLLGWKNVQMRNVVLYRISANDPQTVERYAKDLPQTRLDKLFFDRSLVGLGLGIALLVFVFGPMIGLLAAVVHLNAYLAGSAAVNAIAHHFGRKPYANGAGNLQWLALLTAGEGLHNNHHAAPTSARLSHRWYELDPGWWLIRGLSAVKLAKVRLATVRLKPSAHGVTV
ncbi:MAG: fatty acid desaturase [Actinobacteria bacterium]|jgi:stearoyl-CoA desaturase (delta-9 desaturase)|nr:fatty acid desaturase [Actinomycetota bacterium]